MIKLGLAATVAWGITDRIQNRNGLSTSSVCYAYSSFVSEFLLRNTRISSASRATLGHAATLALSVYRANAFGASSRVAFLKGNARFYAFWYLIRSVGSLYFDRNRPHEPIQNTINQTIRFTALGIYKNGPSNWIEIIRDNFIWATVENGTRHYLNLGRSNWSDEKNEAYILFVTVLTATMATLFTDRYHGKATSIFKVATIQIGMGLLSYGIFAVKRLEVTQQATEAAQLIWRRLRQTNDG